MAKAFQNFASNIYLANNQNLKSVLLITGAEPDQGTTTVVSNLAYSLSEYGKVVIAVDCNLYMPKLHSLFNLSNEYGLTDVLEKNLDPIQAIQKSPFEGLSILSSGPLPSNPSRMLSTPQMAGLINNLGQQFDYILLDTPAPPSLAGIAALAQNVDGVILVVRRSHAKREAVQSIGKFLSKFQDKFIGLVINQAEEISSNHFYQYK
jgi:capsular exopolysaccharide synthesis family protein